MNKMILALASVLMVGATSFANAEVVDVTASGLVEQEAGAMNPVDLETLGDETTFYRSNTGEAIVGGIIGGVIGAIAADRWDRDNGNGYRPGRPGNGFGRAITCYAQNRRGEIFRATARRARVAQEVALEKCYDYSRACRALGCR